MKYQNDDKPGKISGVLTDMVDPTANEYYFWHGLVRTALASPDVH